MAVRGIRFRAPDAPPARGPQPGPVPIIETRVLTMPTYEYRCPEGHEFERFQRMSDEPVADCPTCGRAAQRQISVGGGLLFKGQGFYITDYRSADYKKQAKAEAGGGGTAETGGDAKGRDAKGGDTKAAGKADAGGKTDAGGKVGGDGKPGAGSSAGKD
jgi:putative FmdB family regulatory protein